MQRISSVLCAVAMSVAVFGASWPVQALPLIIEDDPEIAAEAEAARKRSVNILDTSGSSNPGLRALQTLRELQDRRPGFSFSNQPGLTDGGGRMGVGSKGGFRSGGSDSYSSNGAGYSELGDAGLFGSGLNAEAALHERVPEFMSDHAAGVRARPTAYVDPEAVDPNNRSMVRGGTYSVSNDMASTAEQKPGLMSRLLKLIREYRVAVIGSALLLLLLALGASFAAKR
jgi:hypothetical protein